MDEPDTRDGDYMTKLVNFFELAKNDFRSRYAGNVFGVLWAFVYPCITVLLYLLVFQVILNLGAPGGTPYILWLIAPLVPYLFICDCISGSSAAFVDYSYLVKKTKFEIRLLPAVRIASNLFIHVFFILLFLVIKAVTRGLSLGDLRLAYFVAAELAFVSAAGCLMSILTVFFRDIKSIIPVLVQIGYWLTPIFWDISGITPVLKIINPVIYITEGFRNIAIGSAAFGDIWYTVYFWLVTAVLAMFSVFLLARVKGCLSDYL